MRISENPIIANRLRLAENDFRGSSDVVVVDITTPVLNGLDAGQQLKKHSPLPNWG